ncbi:tyrosine-type recombinase/integrase [Amycolatopsis sp. RTGN1]|uniref:tyrosine-type recombinase/integrase n=1 Tax=Amycolatopsis ponsaeliensis TaxID=2992142 RepID=UPI00254A772C|nr:tyrosine-type recombinase/integrase [Amycolatopsis sp. RTGN1]
MEIHEAGRADAHPAVLPRWGRVVAADGVVPWLLLDDSDEPVTPVHQFLVDFVARGNSPGSVRSYAYGLLRWWRWLVFVDVAWDKATSAEVRGLVLWLQQAAKRREADRTLSAATAGTVNPVTRKEYLDDSYKPRTIRHSNAVIRSFYEFWLDLGEAQGPLVNPVPLRRSRGARPNAHHNPLQQWRTDGQLRYNPKIPKRMPRAMTDEQWFALFGALRSNRDRAILAVAVSSAARAAELLGVRPADLDWGEQLIQVTRKGTCARQWLPASAEAFVWIRCYLADLGAPLEPTEPLWQTLRRRDHGTGLVRQPLNYEALRAVFRRVNATLGSNWSMHDLRHTAALRMSRDESLSLRDVQVILGHAHLSTTADVYLVEEEAEVVRRVHQHFSRHADQQRQPAPVAAAGYDDHDLAVLFGKAAR